LGGGGGGGDWVQPNRILPYLSKRKNYQFFSRIAFAIFDVNEKIIGSSVKFLFAVFGANEKLSVLR